MEQGILSLIESGLSNREISQELFTSPETVKWHNKQIFDKLGVSSRTKAVAKAPHHLLFMPLIPRSVPVSCYAAPRFTRTHNFANHMRSVA